MKSVPELLESALKVAGNTHTVDDVRAMVRRGEAQMWRTEGSVAVTEFYVTPHVKALNFWLCAGDLKELVGMLPQIEAWAKEQGCTHALGAGRSAWGRALRRYGFEPSHVVFEKEL